MSTDPIAVRVAHRHRAASELSKPQTVPSFTRRITDDDLSQAVERQVGRLLKVRFRPAMDAGFGAISWEAVNARGVYVTGNIFLRTVVRGGEVVSWAEVTVDQTR